MKMDSKAKTDELDTLLMEFLDKTKEPPPNLLETGNSMAPSEVFPLSPEPLAKVKPRINRRSSREPDSRAEESLGGDTQWVPCK
ncbi:hypothetical protein CYMTET_10430 [Cymbomonas tetramitiformis]|uniref:Uncharacterized protein n=1 Tax=Cymbomonas tetramitiformis TaxID=36881 RepID=A0AAE0GPI8_9CHLO|nr:hypothetical protein CYMTET_10430 [Cymbomonas tetramitiformis]